ncbi:O-acetyl-ADP-ribose deacetylase [Snodgrassella alvi]|jgi:O-acetyl-ADP-ribose deacetylase|uniref:O-acetyl-ADP-ribose deacetylase n=1 Tax=Snodgrassella alvi TaxID=1196083 RepID=UPI000C1F53DF|nr:O-acetyl-ADP-ribose deacetylase [Snodgrassella alvi]PIT09872.1 O-acetyl-ADP-ribose deacetylase [Snodgrassella alvi]PIT60321.1 O-acetyl-ADP-ribose deacetylase [Snodgrassella alvi]
MKNRINIIHGDITKVAVDAIVNAANSSLLGGSGVDGAIHRIGGKQILEECQKIRAKQGGCSVGNAVITRAGNLPARYVIHTVGPRWGGGKQNEAELLRYCYLNSLTLAYDNNVSTISFPNISTGVYKFPKEYAAEIALQTINESLSNDSTIKQVNIVCYDIDNYNIYNKMIQNL